MKKTNNIKDDELNTISGGKQELPESQWHELSYFQYVSSKCEYISGGTHCCQFCTHCKVKHQCHYDTYFCKLGINPECKEGPIFIG
ncbi:MAG: hypothetical protein KBT35_08360 [Firmicutes bacterium]|nr:hypothetical protein [Candidatus Colivicinus equi]